MMRNCGIRVPVIGQDLIDMKIVHAWYAWLRSDHETGIMSCNAWIENHKTKKKKKKVYPLKFELDIA